VSYRYSLEDLLALPTLKRTATTQGADCRWNVGAGRRAIPDSFHTRLRLVADCESAPGPRHGNGLSDPDRGRLRRLASLVAGAFAQRVPLLAIGALSAGLIADIFGLGWAIVIIAAMTFLSGAIVAMAMQERDQR
jgi:hypothetical protein